MRNFLLIALVLVLALGSVDAKKRHKKNHKKSKKNRNKDPPNSHKDDSTGTPGIGAGNGDGSGGKPSAPALLPLNNGVIPLGPNCTSNAPILQAPNTNITLRALTWYEFTLPRGVSTKTGLGFDLYTASFQINTAVALYDSKGRVVASSREKGPGTSVGGIGNGQLSFGDGDPEHPRVVLAAGRSGPFEGKDGDLDGGKTYYAICAFPGQSVTFRDNWVVNGARTNNIDTCNLRFRYCVNNKV